MTSPVVARRRRMPVEQDVRAAPPVTAGGPLRDSRRAMTALVDGLSEALGIELKPMTASSPVRALSGAEAFEMPDAAGTGLRGVLLIKSSRTAGEARSAFPSSLSIAMEGQSAPSTQALTRTTPEAAYTVGVGSTLLRRADFSADGIDAAVFIFQDS